MVGEQEDGRGGLPTPSRVPAIVLINAGKEGSKSEGAGSPTNSRMVSVSGKTVAALVGVCTVMVAGFLFYAFFARDLPGRTGRPQWLDRRQEAPQPASHRFPQVGVLRADHLELRPCEVAHDLST